MTVRTKTGSIALALLLLSGPAPEGRAAPAEALPCKALPAMNRPRSGHGLVAVGPDILAIGGHTTGFIPEASAERFDGHGWTLVPMNYPHDVGFSAPLPDGGVLVGGGSAEAFGIGQTWGVERYDPETGCFEAVGILDRKRACARAASLPDGRVAVAGNWYAEDALGTYVPGEGFRSGPPVSVGRSMPWILSRADGTAFAVGSNDPYGKILESTTADCLDGTSFEIPLLEEWYLLVPPEGYAPQREAVAANTWLLPAMSRADGQACILRACGERFERFPLTEPVPMTGVDGADIHWMGTLLTRRAIRHAYWIGLDVAGRVCVLDIDYDAALDGGEADWVLRVTEPLPHAYSESAWALTPEGDILMAGGISFDNFKPYSDAWLLELVPPATPRAGSVIPWILLAAALLAAVCLLIARRQRGGASPAVSPPERPDLMTQIVRLMEDEQLFRQPDLRVTDIATRLGTNTTYVSATLNGQSGITFARFVEGYRIRYAQRRMLESPGKRLWEIAEESGFSNERSFFRSFKEQTGMTPSGWKAAQGGSRES